MQKLILDFIKRDRSYKGAVALYHQIGLRLSLKKQLNMQPESDYLKGVLFEELRIIANIPADKWNYLTKTPIIKEVTVVIEEIKELVKDKIPIEVRKGIKIRQEYPFLNEASCPNELKILVADKMTAYYKYVEAHKKLFDAATDEELQQLCEDIVDNYIENREIHEELEFYKKEGKVLGKHKIFAQEDMLEKIRQLSIPNLIIKQGNLQSYICKNRKNCELQPTHKNFEQWKANIAKWEIQLTEVNKLLGINK